MTAGAIIAPFLLGCKPTFPMGGVVSGSACCLLKYVPTRFCAHLPFMGYPGDTMFSVVVLDGATGSRLDIQQVVRSITAILLVADQWRPNVAVRCARST